MVQASLKPCPCGKTPERLHVNEGSTFRWRYVSADCECGWFIETRVDTMRLPSDEKDYEECVEDWNQRARG